MPRALVTGPTSGIGKGFARTLAGQGHDLVLVSRDQVRLDEFSQELQNEFGVDVRTISADLTNRSDITAIAEVIRNDSFDVLVNNAGFGVKGAFLDTNVDQEQAMLDILITVVMQLSHAALPGMVNRGRGYVFNVSSVAGWITGGTYSAAKAWVTVFTEGLGVELAGTGVRPIAVCPGFTHTEFHERAGMDMDSVSDWMWLDVDQVVSQAMRDAKSGKIISVAGHQYKALTSLLRILPRPLVRRASGARQTSSRFARGDL